MLMLYGLCTLTYACYVQMRGVSEDFKAELGRANYVTPTSYLELITMFQRLVTAKRVENQKTLSRYTVGLDKLQSSAQQVAGMQQELRVRFPSPQPLLPCWHQRLGNSSATSAY